MPARRVSRTVPAVMRRDRLAIWVALIGMSGLAWLYLGLSASRMSGMDMAGSMELVGLRPWGPVEFALTFLMWAIMMVGMMVPTALPMTLTYEAVARKARGTGAILAPTAVFVGGYVLAWTLFSVGATLAQWGLERAALLSPMMVTTSPRIGAGLLIAAGVYQITPWKDACLSHCRSPVQFMASHWRTGTSGAFRMGIEHGMYCLGCCWLLMGLLFVGGVMNLMWIAAIALFVFVEKLVPHPTLPSRIGGVAMVLTGLGLLISWG